MGDAAVSAAPVDAAGIAAGDAEGAEEAVGRTGAGATVGALGAAPAAPALGVGELQLRALGCAASLSPVGGTSAAAHRPGREAPVAGWVARDAVGALGMRACSREFGRTVGLQAPNSIQ